MGGLRVNLLLEHVAQKVEDVVCTPKSRDERILAQEAGEDVEIEQVNPCF